MRWGRMAVVVAGLLATWGVAHAAGSAPRDVVDQLDTALLDVLKLGEKAGYQKRFDRLKPVMEQTFDLPFMAEKSIGTRWNGLSADDRKRWVALFSEFTVANYAANFDHFSGQRFDVLGEEPAASDTRLVRTRVVTPGAESVELAYRLHQDPHLDGGRWRIVDVYLKGTVSELALRRSDYASVLERNGFEALMTLIRGKVADLAAGRGKREHV